MRSLVAALAALAALLVVAPAAPAARTVPQGFFGVMYDHGIETAPDDAQDSAVGRDGLVRS